MRRLFIEVTSYSAAKKQAPWASKIAKVEGGYLAFECIVEYETWKKQV